jgi:hypothetical protein
MVDKDHRIILVVPELVEGTEVEVEGQVVEPTKARRAGSAKGLINIQPDFDEPLEEFEDYR